ncbi:MAG: FHA domain-containing protein [Lachnospiraceae bacterium]|nr:FHA domain-containing protein [Lachnospiraceae bacterium]
MKKENNRITGRIAAVLLVCLLWIGNTGVIYSSAEEKSDPITEVKKAIVEVYSGFVNQNGKFYKMKSASGFVVAAEDSQSYILTNYDILVNSEKSKKAYCKKHKIKYQKDSLYDALRVVVKDDVVVEAVIMIKSDKQNYGILGIESSMSEKPPVKLGNSEDLSTGDIVYTQGFNKKSEKTEFSEFDVEIYEGNVQDRKVSRDGIFYIQHSAKITKGNTGGPLVNAEGYVVGLNNAAFSKEKEGIYYSLYIDEIKSVLDNFGIHYESKDKDSITEELRAEVKKSEQLLANKNYKTSSKEALSTALESVNYLLREPYQKQESISAALEQLTDAQSHLVLKMKTSRKVIYALAAVIVLLVIWLLRLLWKQGQFEKEKKRTEQAAAYGEKEEASKASKVRKKTGIAKTSCKTSCDSKVKTNEKEKAEEAADPDLCYEKTVILNNEGTIAAVASISCKRTGKGLVISKKQICIGKRAEAVDLAIEDNPAISTRHAAIVLEEGAYYIKDLQSTNGTFVNGTEVEYDQKVKLKNGDKIQLANELFVFHLKTFA